MKLNYEYNYKYIESIKKRFSGIHPRHKYARVVQYKKYPKWTKGADHVVIKQFEIPHFVYIKRDWFFRLLECKLQLENNSSLVLMDLSNIPNPNFDHKVEKRISLKNQISAQKRKITSAKNKLSKVEEQWKGFFPIQEDDRYKKTVSKIEEMEIKLEKMKEDYENNFLKDPKNSHL